MQKPKNLGTAKWGMVTRHQKPFGDGVNETTAKQFDKAHTELVDRYIRKTFKGYWGEEKQIIQDFQKTIGETITFFGVQN